MNLEKYMGFSVAKIFCTFVLKLIQSSSWVSQAWANSVDPRSDALKQAVF